MLCHHTPWACRAWHACNIDSLVGFDETPANICVATGLSRCLPTPCWDAGTSRTTRGWRPATVFTLKPSPTPTPPQDGQNVEGGLGHISRLRQQPCPPCVIQEKFPRTLLAITRNVGVVMEIPNMELKLCNCYHPTIIVSPDEAFCSHFVTSPLGEDAGGPSWQGLCSHVDSSLHQAGATG